MDTITDLARISNADCPCKMAVLSPISLATMNAIEFDSSDFWCDENIAIAGFCLSGASEFEDWSDEDFESCVEEEIQGIIERKEAARGLDMLEYWVDFLREFIASPSIWWDREEEEDGTYGLTDLWTYESNCAPESPSDLWDEVGGSWHSGMGDGIYGPESRLRDGERLTLDELADYTDRLADALFTAQASR